MKKGIFIISIMLLLAVAVSGQGFKTVFFKESQVLKPFLSEIRSTVIKTEFALLNKLDNNYYIRDYSKRPFIETHLGVDMPLINFYNPAIKLRLILAGR